jgi:hypothetical protein
MSVDPIASNELLEQGLIKPAGRLHIDILNDGVLPQACEPQPSDQPLVVALGRFAIDKQRETLVEGQCGDVGLSLLFVECFRHADESELDQAGVGRMRQHRLSFLQW